MLKRASKASRDCSSQRTRASSGVDGGTRADVGGPPVDLRGFRLSSPTSRPAWARHASRSAASEPLQRCSALMRSVEGSPSTRPYTNEWKSPARPARAEITVSTKLRYVIHKGSGTCTSRSAASRTKLRRVSTMAWSVVRLNDVMSASSVVSSSAASTEASGVKTRQEIMLSACSAAG